MYEGGLLSNCFRCNQWRYKNATSPATDLPVVRLAPRQLYEEAATALEDVSHAPCVSGCRLPCPTGGQGDWRPACPTDRDHAMERRLRRDGRAAENSCTRCCASDRVAADDATPGSVRDHRFWGRGPTAYGTHSMRRTKPTLIYRRTKNLRAVQLLLGHTKLESTVRYLGIEVDDALEIAEQTEV